MSACVWPYWLRNFWNWAAVVNPWAFLAVASALAIWALVTLIPSLCASAWYQ